MERYFVYKDIQEVQKYKIAKVKLKGYGDSWLQGEQRARTLRGKAPISTWNKMKKRMRDRFIPHNYKQSQYVKWSTLQQNGDSVEDYIKEFDRLAIVCEDQDGQGTSVQDVQVQSNARELILSKSYFDHSMHGPNKSSNGCTLLSMTKYFVESIN